MTCCCYYEQSGAALLHEKCEPPLNSTSHELKYYRSVQNEIAHHVVERTPVVFNLTQSYGDFSIFVLSSGQSKFFYYYFVSSVRPTVLSGQVM